MLLDLLEVQPAQGTVTEALGVVLEEIPDRARLGATDRDQRHAHGVAPPLPGAIQPELPATLSRSAENSSPHIFSRL